MFKYLFALTLNDRDLFCFLLVVLCNTMVISILIIAANSQMLHWNSFYHISSRRQRMHRPSAGARTGNPFSENKEIKLYKYFFKPKKENGKFCLEQWQENAISRGNKKFNINVSNALSFRRSASVRELIIASPFAPALVNWSEFFFRPVSLCISTTDFNLLNRNLMHKIKDQRIWAKNNFYALLTCHNEYDISMTSTVAYFQCYVEIFNIYVLWKLKMYVKLV